MGLKQIVSLRFSPRLTEHLKSYDAGKFTADLTAGITVGVVALPLAMAFAIASGLKPEAGIFTAIVAGLLISALGGSSVQIGGPAGAFIVIVYGIVERYGVANLLLATMFSGVLLFAMGLFRLGNLVRLVPVTIVIGFTNGIAVLIALSQVKEFFGLEIDSMPADFFNKLSAIAQSIGTIHLPTLILSMVSLAIIIFWPKTYAAASTRSYRILSRLPGTIVALVVATCAVVFLHLDVETIGSRFGGIPQGLPNLALPEFSWGQVRYLFAPAVTIALLGAIESLLCARVADAMIEERHDPNQELMAQGIANVVTPLFGGFCATGTIARTVTNIRAGARTPIAGIIHSAVLMIIVLIAAPLAQHIPLGALAAILMFVAYNMGEWHEFVRLRRFSINYRVILLTTFALTVIFDLTVAVEVGLVLACLFFISRVSSLTRIEPLSETEAALEGIDLSQVEVFRVSGSLFFGAVSKMEGLLDPKRETKKWMILDMSGVLNIDTTGLEALETLHGMLAKRGSTLMLAGVPEQSASLIQRSGFAEKIGTQNIVRDMAHARKRIADLMVVTPAI
jgi:sulfate permease, SulP family